jgi:hypothetical protein
VGDEVRCDLHVTVVVRRGGKAAAGPLQESVGQDGPRRLACRIAVALAATRSPDGPRGGLAPVAAGPFAPSAPAALSRATAASRMAIAVGRS